MAEDETPIARDRLYKLTTSDNRGRSQSGQHRMARRARELLYNLNTTSDELVEVEEWPKMKRE